MGHLRTYSLLTWLMVLLVSVTSDIAPLFKDKPRSIRGFKSSELATARGFGKRADPEFTSSLDSFHFTDKDSFPADWFADEVQNNEDLARLIVQKFIDINQDGELSADELLRPLFDKQASPYK